VDNFQIPGASRVHGGSESRKQRAMSSPSPITADCLAASAVRHGFFTRVGGVSTGDFTSLNCGFGSGDDPEHVAENRRRTVAELLGSPGLLVTAHQKHTTDVHVVREPWPHDRAPVGDALVSDRPGIALGILTADCAPVLMADASAGVIGAAHAGWRGAFYGVVEATLAKMIELGADPANISAAIGPCIGQESYEVGPEFVQRFVARNKADADLFRPSVRDGHAMFDLPLYVERRLRAAGIVKVAWTGDDTCADGARFFSYRRMCLVGEKTYGRGVSVIALA
jgi:YfiH family protein